MPKKVKNKVDKPKLIRELIRSNPNLNATEIIALSKSKGFSIRKTDQLAIFRSEKKLPEPTIQKKEKSTPIKYRKPVKITTPKGVKFPTQKGSYGIAEVFYNKDDSKYIKFKNKADFERQLDIIKKNYGKKMKVSFHGIFTLVSFIDKEFQELLPFIQGV